VIIVGVVCAAGVVDGDALVTRLVRVSFWPRWRPSCEVSASSFMR